MATEQMVDHFNSPATKYEALLAEQRSKPLSKDTALLAFRVLDQLLPNMGVFQRVTKMCRDQLFDAVFSDQYTGTVEGEARLVGRMTYFEIVQQGKCLDEERLEVMEEQMDVVKKMLFDKQKQFEDAEGRVDELKDRIFNLDTTVVKLEDVVAERKLEIRNLKATLDEERDRNANKEHCLQCDLAEFEEDLHEAQSEVTYLNAFKSGYDDLHQAFIQRPTVADDNSFPHDKDPTGAIATKRAYFISSVVDSDKLEQQLLMVQNASVEEFDTFLETHKLELTKRDDDDDDEDIMVQLDRADQQLALTQDRFRNTTAQLNHELALLRQHRNMLLEQLQMLEESRPQMKKSQAQKIRSETQDSAALSAGLTATDDDDMDDDDDDDDDAVLSDPFIPQERIFCKYAAMMYTSSDDSKTFHEFAEAAYCPSCGEKTVLCPHKILGQEQVFQLPAGTTSIKISRPRVRLNHEILRPILLQAGNLDDRSNDSTSLLGGSKSFISPEGSFSVDILSAYASMNAHESMPAASAGQRASVADTSCMGFSIRSLLEDYSKRTSLERKVSRTLPVERVVSLTEQFASYLFWQDDYAAGEETEQDVSFLDTLYQFMTERYLKEDIAFFATHDLFTALSEHCNTNKLVWLLSQVLVGHLDGAAFRYILLMGDFIERVDWQNADDFRAFAEVVYPFLSEDDLETLQIGFTSFGENKISKTLVSEYIIYCITKNREPLFVETEARLQSERRVTTLSEQQFSEACDAALAVVCSEPLRRALYRQASAYVAARGAQPDAVPLRKLAQIASYLSVLHRANVIKAAVSGKVVTARTHVTSTAGGKSVSSHTSHVVKSAYRLMTMSDAKALGASIAKRDLCRQLRRQSIFDDDDDY